MKFFAALLPVALVACTNGPVTEKDLSERQFQASVDTNAIDPRFRAMAVAIGAGGRVFSFEKGGNGTIEAKSGPMTGKLPITWSMQGDSLTIDVDAFGQHQRTAYAVSRQDGDLRLDTPGNRLILSTPYIQTDGRLC
ncbi:hypothetical protein ACAW74_26065 [Fibrella sp. WM1]|uniref:hypothetical protein n=1 Tax=Fibrella musci TaxID=3242485 RepID=UPI0035208AAF